MSAVKRSAALTLVVTLVGLLAGCGGSAPEASVKEAQQLWSPVATLTEQTQWIEGVRPYPLRVGQSVLFWFGDEVSPDWTMRGVKFPLRLTALEADGQAGKSIEMQPCLVPVCKTYKLDAKAVGWLETRIKPTKP